jgi:hypothetical protein
MHVTIFWTDFKMPPINLWSMPIQYLYEEKE